MSVSSSRRIRRTLGVLAAPLPVLVLALPVAHAATAPTRVAFAGSSTPHLASDAVRTGSVAATTQVPLEISLKPRDQAGLDAFLREVSDPASPQYKHYLTVPQYAAAYGATDAQIAEVAKYLRGQGLSVGAATANHLTLAASGTAAQVEKAFGVQPEHLPRPAGRDVFANTTAPTLPADVASVVSGVAGLSTTSIRTAANHVDSNAAPHAGTVLTPTKARGGYNLTSSISAGYNGSGQTVGLVEFSAYRPPPSRPTTASTASALRRPPW